MEMNFNPSQFLLPLFLVVWVPVEVCALCHMELNTHISAPGVRDEENPGEGGADAILAIASHHKISQQLSDNMHVLEMAAASH